MKELLETQLQPDAMERGIRALAAEITSTLEDVVKSEVAQPIFDPPAEIKYNPSIPDGMVDYVGHIKDVPDDVRKKFQAKFRRRYKSTGYYRRVTNGRKDVAYGFSWMLDDGTWAQASLYDYRCSLDVEFILCAAPSGPADRNMKDHEFFWSADPRRDSAAISENVARWAESYGQKHYSAVTVWRPDKYLLRIGDIWRGYNFQCYSIESFSFEDDICLERAVNAVILGLQKAGMPFYVHESLPQYNTLNGFPGACDENADRSHHSSDDLDEVMEIRELGRSFNRLME